MIAKLKIGAFAIASIILASSCSKEDHSPVKADFEISSEIIQINSEIHFTNLSKGASDYVWDFGDGQSSVESNPVHQYAVAGEFTIRLTAAGENGVHETIKVITVEIQEDIVEGASVKGISLGQEWSEIKDLEEWDFEYQSTSSTAYGNIHVMCDRMKGTYLYLLAGAKGSGVSSYDKVYFISVTTGFRGATSKKIKLGNKKEMLFAAYGTPEEHDTESKILRYNSLGIMFSYNNSGLISQIAIFAPGMDL